MVHDRDDDDDDDEDDENGDDWLTDWLTGWLTDWLTVPPTDWVTGSTVTARGQWTEAKTGVRSRGRS